VAGAVARWLPAAPPGWAALLESDPNATAAHRPGLVASLAAVLPGHEPAFVAVERDGELLGGGPVVVTRVAGFRWLYLLPFSLPGAPLARAGEHAGVDPAFADALAGRAAELGVVGGAWSCYRPAGPPADLDVLARVPGETRWIETALLDLSGGFDPALRAMDKKTRNELRRAHERLSFDDDPGAVDEAYALHQAQGRQWPGHRPLPLALARRLLEERDGRREPIARLFVVRDGRGLLSAGLVLDHASECFVWWTGSHPDARRSHAVTRLFGGVAEWAAERGRARFNLGASVGMEGVAAFKRSLGGAPYRYPIRWIAARGAVARGLATLQGWVRRGRSRGSAA
jgi:hypothetical protein